MKWMLKGRVKQSDQTENRVNSGRMNQFMVTSAIINTYIQIRLDLFTYSDKLRDHYSQGKMR